MDFEPLSTHPLFFDLTGKRYGRWMVLGFLGREKKDRPFKWWCRCDCGTERSVTGANLCSEDSVSCGCLIHEKKTDEPFADRNKKYQQKYRSKNKEVRRQKLRDWRSAAPERQYAYNRDYSYRRKYGMTYAAVESLLVSQEGCCKICRDEIKLGGTGGPAVDHDHVTGDIRGVLCKGCNLGIAFFQEKAEIMLAAIAYLAEAKAKGK